MLEGEGEINKILEMVEENAQNEVDKVEKSVEGNDKSVAEENDKSVAEGIDNEKVVKPSSLKYLQSAVQEQETMIQAMNVVNKLNTGKSSAVSMQNLNKVHSNLMKVCNKISYLIKTSPETFYDKGKQLCVAL